MWEAIVGITAWMWANVDKLAAAVAAVAIIPAAIVFLLESSRFRRTLVLGVHGQLFTSSFNALNVLFENPSLRQYLYEGQAIPADATPELEQRIRVTCEMYSDHFELVCLQMEKIQSDGTWLGWINHMTDVISQSPPLREHFRQTAAWVTAPAFKAVVTKGFERAGEPVPEFGRLS